MVPTISFEDANRYYLFRVCVCTPRFASAVVLHQSRRTTYPVRAGLAWRMWEGTARCELWKPVWFFHLLYLFPIHACICKFCIVVASSFLLIRMAPSKHMESLNQYSLFESGLGSFRLLKSFTPIPFHIILQLLQSMCWRSSCMNGTGTKCWGT